MKNKGKHRFGGKEPAHSVKGEGKRKVQPARQKKKTNFNRTEKSAGGI